MEIIKKLGPGIMMASACVGGSHLVASTKAGAIYGWQLAGLILLVNFLKYPFFRAGVQYTMGSGQSLVQGYAKLGLGYLKLFLLLSVISAMVNTAALLLFSANLLGYFVPFSLSISALSTIVLATCLAILFAGHYKVLNTVSKVIMVILTLTTLLAVVIALGDRTPMVSHTPTPSPWTLAAIGFIVITMGWMPAPIEISTFTSTWLKSQQKQQRVTLNSALFDFNVGYITTALLAIAFLALGALILHGSGIALSQSGIGFSHQLVSLYASTIGEWSRYLIAFIAFIAIFGSTITLIDGYGRVIAEGQSLLTKKETSSHNHLHHYWMGTIALVALAIIFFGMSALMTLLNFAMMLAFITTPFFALLNTFLVTNKNFPEKARFGFFLKALSIAGLVYLFGFLILFAWWQWCL